MTNGVPPACKKLADEINQLQEAIDNLQKTVFGPDGLDKNVIRQIGPVRDEIPQPHRSELPARMPGRENGSAASAGE